MATKTAPAVKFPTAKKAAAKAKKAAAAEPAAAKAAKQKPAAAKKADSAAAPAAAADHVKGKDKLVRDSFTMPKADFELVQALKNRTLGFQRETKKSELLRAGLHALVALNDEQLKQGLDALAPLKAGRPKKAD